MFKIGDTQFVCQILFVTIGAVSIFLLVSCASADPSIGESFLKALNVGDVEAADQYVCPSQKGKLSEKVLRRLNTPPKGADVLGLKSPGVSEIKCETASSTELTCSFWAPELQCTGNILMGESVTCTSWKLKGEQKSIQFILEDDKICDYD
jgi:hypothetical protein